jgi:acetyl-CoA C-acetyltransferase
MPEPRPVIVGVAQFNPRNAATPDTPEPIEMMARAARSAADDSGAPAILDRLDALAVVNILSWQCQNPPDALAARLGINPARKIYTSIGGNTPQYLVNQFAREIAAGRMRAAMVAGVEVMYTARRAAARGGARWDSALGKGDPELMGDPRAGTNAYEERYGARLPVQIYPLFENARRAHHRWTLDEHRAHLGRMCAAMTRVAANNPHAWFRTERSADEIATPSPANRVICFPYTKLMNAIIDVDLSAALIIASDVEARRAGIAPERMVYLHAAADATDRWFVSERAYYHESPGLALSAKAALEGAGVAAGEIGFFDFYSCFPVAVGFAMDALGIAPADPRGVTVTGGLPYAGGPGNNYVTHSIAAMTQRLRENPGSRGMVTGLGWYFTKHAAAIYSSAPPERPFAYRAFPEPPPGVDAIEVIENAEGPSAVETYTVEHDRDGAPAHGIVVGRLAGGARFFAGVPREILPAMEREEFVGRRGRVRVANGLNLFEPF